MHIEVVGFGSHGDFPSFIEILAALESLGSIVDIAPSSSWEEYFSRVLAESVGIQAKFESWTKHDVILLILVGKIFVGELKEHWFVEGTTFKTESGDLSVVVSQKVVLVIHCISYDVKICDRALVDVFSKEVGLLGCRTPVVVISWERVEWSNNVPSSTKFWICVVDEATYISTC